MSGLRDHLQAIYNELGRLTPDDVVNVASDPAHPLHKSFEWDDSVAGAHYRREQARNLIKSVRVTYTKPGTEEPRSVRAWHAVRYVTLEMDDEGEEIGPGRASYVYEPAEKIAADPILARIRLAEMQREWRIFRRRYEEFAEFWEMIRSDLQQGDKAA